MTIKYFLLIWSLLSAATFGQKCKKPKVPLLEDNKLESNHYIFNVHREMLAIQSRTRPLLATKRSALLLARRLQHGSDILTCEL